MGVLKTLDFVLNHPLNRNQRFRALTRFLRWQLGSRLVPGPVVSNFVNDSQLLVKPGMAGVTGNVYAGLHEFWEMAFTLHMLREDDLFVDVGANVGVYTVLASAVIGARSVAFEPIPEMCDWLRANVRLNDIGEDVTIHQSAVGEQKGTVRMTDSLGPLNHVVSEERRGIDVPVETLDEGLQHKRPTLVKIDVEGYEAVVIKGALSTLASDSVLAAIVEVNGNEARYGQTSKSIIQRLHDLGFESFIYEPTTRDIESHDPGASRGGNILFIKDKQSVQKRLEHARPFLTHTGARV